MLHFILTVSLFWSPLTVFGADLPLSCENEIRSQLSPKIETIVRSLARRDEILKSLALNKNFLHTLTPEDLVENLIVFAEGWDAGAMPTLGQTEAEQLADYFGLKYPFSSRWAENTDWYRTEWIRQNLFYKSTNVVTVLGDELINRDIPWVERARIFRHFLKDPRIKSNPHIGSFALDPLLGLDSIGLARRESARPGPKFIDDPITNQRTAIGYRPFVLWSDYSDLDVLFSNGKIKKDDLVVDIGSGTGRVAFYLAAVYPEARVLGLEFMSTRIAFAQAVVDRFGLQKQIEFRQTNLELEKIPLAQHYFYFNSLTKKPAERVAQSLSRFARDHDFQLYVSYDPQNKWTNRPWLEVLFQRVKTTSRVVVDPWFREVRTEACSHLQTIYHSKKKSG